MTKIVPYPVRRSRGAARHAGVPVGDGDFSIALNHGRRGQATVKVFNSLAARR